MSLTAISFADADFCLNKELWSVLAKHEQAIQDSAFAKPTQAKWLNLYKNYAENKADTLSIIRCLEKLALNHSDFDSAVLWFSLVSEYQQGHPDFPVQAVSEQMLHHFTGEADNLLLKVYKDGASEDSLYIAIAELKSYNKYVEELAKALLDMISVERNDSLAYALTEKFYATFPHSKWNQALYYFELSHHVFKKDYDSFFATINTKSKLSPAHSYLTTLFLISPLLRRDIKAMRNNMDLSSDALTLLINLPQKPDSHLVLYDIYSQTRWSARVKLQKAKVLYYQLIEPFNYYGDEDSLYALFRSPTPLWKDIDQLLDSIAFENNDTGELAELSFWKGKLYSLLPDIQSQEKAAKYFTECLVYGSPRKKYDFDAQKHLTILHKRLKVQSDLLSWQRSLMSYSGISFKDITETAGLGKNRETRIALGDYNNDSYADILLNGKRLYQNNKNLTFKEVTDTTSHSTIYANGGLFADFNLDGKLDYMTTSHAAEGNGERLMKNNGDRFVPVNERAGEIDDTYPTEGAAWVDCFFDGYPDLYLANYEKWQVQNGYEDRFWNNKEGYFIDYTSQLGFLKPNYTFDPPQAGRGIAPADFDNDGIQEILVTNYRLCRNFLWNRQDTVFVDLGALTGLSGINKKGYYGHSIGADWGDFDNDGDLDVFIANLAHPRYIDISDVSMLLRNDGLKQRVIESDTISYWQFTDVTKQAGITYDELHSDPLWIDADNDGFLDLFITSVYENDRSYLYHNNGNGTFTDITWLAGIRVYNGWGNATADLNHDGKLDIIVGSANGTKVFVNQTPTDNKSIIFKPVWDKGKISLISSYPAMKNHPNSPAYGTRVIMTLKTPQKKQITLIRELSSAKGTTSQNDQILHFGLGKNKIQSYEIFNPKPSKP
jgi:hypothetical protein